MPECMCRMMRGGMIMSSRGRVKTLRQKQRSMLNGGELLLNPTATVFDSIPTYEPINLTSGKGLKSDMMKLTDKLDKLTLMKPKNVKKNIRVAL